MKRLWAPWRMTYVAGSRPPGGCVLCEAPRAGDDRARFLLLRGTHGYLILNAYPYAAGHLMAVLYRHIATLAEATGDGDANFVTVIGEVRVLPETLETTYDRLKRRLDG